MKPEVLAPVGDRDSLRVALAAGADAVYLGLDEGFNARARATNLPLADLPEVVREVHAVGARVYVTLNTLVFPSELDRAAHVVAALARAGVDALIVQDPAICLLARQVAPGLVLHASTQMTVSSPEGSAVAADLGVTRVVVPRELSVAEIARFRAGTTLELEVFVHGALCMSWSGQCLTSEAWGGRSANRGQCAQSCRFPYDLVVDGVKEDLGDVRYLLSPLDLAGYDAVPALAEIGVHTLKIEGRLKGPAYVATAVGGLRRWVDAIADGRHGDPAAQAQLGRDLLAMGATYSRGFSSGFLDRIDHQALVPGRFPKSRGVFVGVVSRVDGPRIHVRAEVDLPLQAGHGVGFDQGRPEEEEPGGRLEAAVRGASGWTLTLERSQPTVRVGDGVYWSSDPAQAALARRLARSAPTGRVRIDLIARGAVGRPLELVARSSAGSVRVTSGPSLEASRGQGLDAEALAAKVGAFGGTAYHLGAVEVDDLEPGGFLPPSALKAVRRSLVAALDAARVPAHEVSEHDAVAAVRARRPVAALDQGQPRLVVLCRTDAQLDAVLAAGLPEVELDWMERVGLSRAVGRARAAGVKVTIATVRVQKPGEAEYDAHTERLAPDGVLVRHWGALAWFRDHPGPVLHGDFSLNVTNDLTARYLLGWGLSTVTASHDLDESQLMGLLGAVPADRVTVVVHQHVPAFHTEHCVYAARLSNGRDHTDCGRPCERHRVALRDPVGLDHPVLVDVACRNTVFHAAAQCAPHLATRVVRAGVRRLRVELVWETADEAARVVDGWRRLLDGRWGPRQLVASLRVHEQFGVTRGTTAERSP